MVARRFVTGTPRGGDHLDYNGSGYRLFEVSRVLQEKRPQTLDRRHFLRSLFGLGTALDSLPVEAKPPARYQPESFRFFWSDLRTGQMGFPCGQVVPKGQPGSVMKLVAASALLETRTLQPETKFECKGTYHCSAHEAVHCLYPHGMVDLPHALGLSCNIYFAQAAKHLSPNVLIQYARDFGLDQPVGSFEGGVFPVHPAHPSWQYVLGLSSDLQPSALQIMRMSALVATRGNVPYLHSAEEPDAKGRPFECHLSGGTFAVLQDGMEMACRQGTGKKLDPHNKLKVALKTGTAPYGKAFQSWVTGYFPWDHPRYAFCLRSLAGTSYDQAIPALKNYLFGTEWP